MFGIEIHFKDGKRDWIDPVSEDPVERNGRLIVENSRHTYEYIYADIEKWVKYSLCNECEFDARSYDCTDSDCFNPHIMGKG